jgi:hypothetical protein
MADLDKMREAKDKKKIDGMNEAVSSTEKIRSWVISIIS